jgi:hypothetical protein
VQGARQVAARRRSRIGGVRMVVRQVGVWSVARIYGALCAAIGLLAGIVVALFSLVGAGIAAQSSDAPAWLGPMFGMGAVVFLPIFYGVMGIVMGALTAVLYNLFAGLVGGIELDIQ